MYIITRERGTHRTDAILPFQIVVTKFILWKIFSCELKFQKVIIVIVLEVLRVESNMVISCSSQSSKIVFVFSFRSLQRTQFVDLATYREGLYPLRQRPSSWSSCTHFSSFWCYLFESFKMVGLLFAQSRNYCTLSYIILLKRLHNYTGRASLAKILNLMAKILHILESLYIKYRNISLCFLRVSATIS